MTIIGESCALFAAFSLVSGSTLFSKIVKHFTPLLLNLLSNSVSIFINIIALYFLSDCIFPSDTFNNYVLLIISGILGISLGDTFYFVALEYIGARQTIMLETLAPPFCGIISYFYFGTTLPIQGWIGIFIICYGIYIVVNEKEQKEEPLINNDLEAGIELSIIDNQCLEATESQDSTSPNIQKLSSVIQKCKESISNNKRKVIGILNAIGYTICQALGVVFSSDGLSSGNFSSLQSGFLRILSGTVAIYIMYLFKKGEKFQKPKMTQREYVIFFTACTLSLFIGMWAQQMSIIYTRPEISQTIMSTSPIFSLAISWYSGETMKLKYFVGAILAIIGVILLVWK